MIRFPTAKINIGLNIVKKRDDGFHSIESVFHAVPLTDAIEIIENKDGNAKNITFTSSGIDIPGNSDDNLCCKAYHLINIKYTLPNIKVHLHKNIPIGAGLGGGSADAAFFIRLLNDQFELKIPMKEMEDFARQLGSDCTFFIKNTPAFTTERGDMLEDLKLDLKGYHLVLIYPNIHINTAKAYSGVQAKPAKRSLKNDIINLPVEEWKNVIHNDFENSIFPQFPEIKKIKEQLYTLGAEYAAMSGSGSTVFGIFKKETNLKNSFSTAFFWEGGF